MLFHKPNHQLGLKCPRLIKCVWWWASFPDSLWHTWVWDLPPNQKHGFSDRLLFVFLPCSETMIWPVPLSLLFHCLSVSLDPSPRALACFVLFCFSVALSETTYGYQHLSSWQGLLTRLAFYWLSAFNLDNPCIISRVSIFRRLSSCGCVLQPIL